MNADVFALRGFIFKRNVINISKSYCEIFKEMADQDSFEDEFDNSISFNTSSIEAECPISKLKVALESASPTFEIEEWQQSLKESLCECKTELLDENVFSQILPVAHTLLSRILKEIEKLLTNTSGSSIMNNIKDKLFNCKGILNLYETSIEHVSNLGKVSIQYVKSLPDILPSSIKLVFEHCKSSSSIYGKFFQVLSKELMSLFQKANGIHKLFFTILENVILYNTNVESEASSLLNVIKLLGAIAASSHGLDLKTFVSTTTFFAKLAITHRDDIKTSSPTNVMISLQLIAKEADTLYSTILEANSKKEERMLKGASIILNIITKLTSAYSKYLSNDVLLTLIGLLSRLHRYIAISMDSKTIGIQNDNISSGTMHLLNAVLKNSNFCKAYFEYGLNKDINKFDYHLLTLAILQAIDTLPCDEYNKWVLGTQSILDIAFTNFDYLQEELCVGELQLFGNYNIEEDSVDLYTATLISICKLVVLVPCNNFHIIEKLLLKNLLSGSYWCSLLSCDVWYCIGRYGSSQLCSSHVKYLMRVYAALAERRDALETCFLKNLIERLFTLLPENERHTVVVESSDIDSYNWTPFAQLLPYKTQMVLRERLGCSVKSISDAVDTLFQEPSARHWFQLMKLLPASCKLSNITEKEMIDIISKVWNFISSTVEGCDQRYSLILSDFSISILDGTHHDFVYQDSIINAIANFSLHALPHAKIRIAYYLEDLAMSFRSDQLKAMNTFSEINCRLLEDENPWVSQDMLECFDRLAHTCPNEELVAKMANAISRKSVISESVPAYLSNTQYYKLQDITDIKSYLSCLVKDYVNGNMKHVCIVFKDFKRDVKIPRMEEKPSGKMKCENVRKELDERVNRICDELYNILKRKNEISDVALRNLRAVLTRFQE